MKLLLCKDSKGLQNLNKDFFLKVFEFEKSNNVEEKDSIFIKYNLEEYSNLWIENINEECKYLNYLYDYLTIEQIENILNKMKDSIQNFLKTIPLNYYGYGNFEMFELNAKGYSPKIPIAMPCGCGISLYPEFCFALDRDKTFYVNKFNCNLIFFRSNKNVIEAYEYFKLMNKNPTSDDLDFERFFIYEEDDITYSDKNHAIAIKSYGNRSFEYVESFDKLMKN